MKKLNQVVLFYLYLNYVGVFFKSFFNSLKGVCAFSWKMIARASYLQVRNFFWKDGVEYWNEFFSILNILSYFSKKKFFSLFDTFSCEKRNNILFEFYLLQFFFQNIGDIMVISWSYLFICLKSKTR